jgi:hypothetical protein
MNRTFIALFVAAISAASLPAQDNVPPTESKVVPTNAKPDAVTNITATGDSPAAVRSSRRSRSRRQGYRDLVMVGNDVSVKAGEEFGDVVVVRGNASIDGTVRGDLVSVLGQVRLGPQAVVKGDVVTVAGALEADPAAEVDGDTVSVGPNLFGWGEGLKKAVWWVRWPGQWVQYGLAQGRVLPHEFGWSWITAGLALLLYLIVALLFPRSIQNTVGMLSASPARALGAGLLGFLAAPALLLLLAITGVGLVVVPFVLDGS